MCIKSVKNEEEINLQSNILKTAIFLFDALTVKDYESAKIELEKLKFSIKRMEEIQIKKERREALLAIVLEMKKRGINIDFAKRSNFFEIKAKNDVKPNKNNSKITEKRQQA